MREVDAVVYRLSAPYFDSDVNGKLAEEYMHNTLMQAAQNLSAALDDSLHKEGTRSFYRPEQTIRRAKASLLPVHPSSIEDKGAYRLIHLHAPHQDNRIYTFTSRNELVQTICHPIAAPAMRMP